MNKERPLKKTEFRDKVLNLIREKMVFTTGNKDAKEEIDYAELNYEKHPQYITEVLLLFNVETISQKGDENNRFPFDRYKEGAWSLEHIHAQNSESLKTNQEWEEWLSLHKKSLEALLQNDNDKARIEDAIVRMDKVIEHIKDSNYKGSIRDEFNDVTTTVVTILSDSDDNSQMHSLSNMALLTVCDNAALSNSTFDVKRAKIIEMDKRGEYIPICTRNVFMKYYSSSDTKLHFWAEEDRKDYIKYINKVLYEGISSNVKEPIKLIKSPIVYGNR